MNKPSNWYQMDYQEQREWEKQKQAFDDLEYDRQRAQEAAEQAEQQAARQRRSMQSEREEWGYEYESLVNTISGKDTIIGELIAALNPIIPSDRFFQISAEGFADDEIISASATRAQWKTLRALIAKIKESE